MSVDKVIRIGRLFSFYGSLLTQKQQEFVNLYYNHDLSLGEIAEQKGISRQAVYDNLKKSEGYLEEYENNLGLLKSYDLMQEEIDRLSEVIENEKINLSSDSKKVLDGIVFRLQAYQEGELM